jgi:hypothetical protein
MVKWTSNGVDQFDARKVEWVSEDGSHLRVIGSATGIPMNEVEKVEVPAAMQIQRGEPERSETKSETASTADGSRKVKSVTTSVVGNRLQISADVSADEIDALKAMLTKYQEILKLLN